MPVDLPMWCTVCQQDVPALASSEDDRVRCVKCRTEMISSASASASGAESRVWEPPSDSDSVAAPENKAPLRTDLPPFDFDTWDWDELREATRAVHAWGTKTPEQNSLRLPQSDSAVQFAPLVSTAARKPGARRPKRSRHLAYVSWTTLSLGIMACVFGGILLAWSYVTDRAELWTLGLPFAIGGQVALVLGLVLQLDGLWQSNHEAVESLSNLDEQLLELRRATSQISSSHSGPSQSFYFHLAEGCSPHMLLADLKGQLDLLALRIADHK